MCSPDIVSDQEKYTKLMKELKHLTPVVEKYREYKKALQNIEDSKMMLEEGSADAEFIQMVKDELEKASRTRRESPRSLRFSFCPGTPMMTRTLLSR